MFQGSYFLAKPIEEEEDLTQASKSSAPWKIELPRLVCLVLLFFHFSLELISRASLVGLLSTVSTFLFSNFHPMLGWVFSTIFLAFLFLFFWYVLFSFLATSERMASSKDENHFESHVTHLQGSWEPFLKVGSLYLKKVETSFYETLWATQSIGLEGSILASLESTTLSMTKANVLQL